VFAARAGPLNGRNATTHEVALDTIEQEGAILQHGRVVDDGDLISSGGVTSGIDLALYLVERYGGGPLAIQVEQVIMYERRGVVWRA
jgi:transcriptional regulator GlxA family with amidase domain